MTYSHTQIIIKRPVWMLSDKKYLCYKVSKGEDSLRFFSLSGKEIVTDKLLDILKSKFKKK